MLATPIEHMKSLSWLGKSWLRGDKLFFASPWNIAWMLLSCHFLRTCCLFCCSVLVFPLGFFFLVLTFSCLNWASRDPHLTILLLFVTLPFVPCMIVLYRLSHSAFSERSSLLGSLCQGYKAVLFQSWAGFLAWILGSQAAKSIQKIQDLMQFHVPLCESLKLQKQNPQRMPCEKKIAHKQHKTALL